MGTFGTFAPTLACRGRRRPAPVCLEALERRDAPATFTVTNTSDTGTGSLRKAITDANATVNVGGPNRIHFNIPSTGVQSIRPPNDLPQITESVVIDGYTQPGSWQPASTWGR